jgi:hypothetical protein
MSPQRRTSIAAAVIILLLLGPISCSWPFPEPTPETDIFTVGPLYGYVEAEIGSVAGYPNPAAQPVGLSASSTGDVLLGLPDHRSSPEWGHSYLVNQGRFVAHFTVFGLGPAFLTVVAGGDGHGLMGAGDEINGRAVFIVASPVGAKLRLEGEVGQSVNSLRMEIDNDGDGTFDESVEPDIARTGDDLDGYWDYRTAATIEELGSGEARVSLAPAYDEGGIDQTYYWLFPSDPEPHRYTEPFVVSEPSYILFTSFDLEGNREDMQEAKVLGGAPDFNRTIGMNEEFVITFQEPGQVAHLTFEGREGQRVVPQSLTSNLSPFPCCGGSLRVLGPNGRGLAQQFGIATGLSALPTVVLPTDGDYTFVVDPYFAYTGDVTVMLEDLDDVFAKVQLDGPPQTITFEHGEQLGFVTFEGEKGEQISIVVEHPGDGCCSANATVRSPSGMMLASGFVHSHYEDVVTLRIGLPEDGTYTIELEPGVERPGDMVVAAYAVNDVKANLRPDDSPHTVEITVPGQTAELAFSGTAGQKWHISVSDWVAAGTRNRLLHGDGRTKLSILDASLTNELVRAWLSPQGISVVSVILPVDGEYTVLLDPPDKTTGSLEIGLHSTTAGEPRLTAEAMPDDGTSSIAAIDDPQLRIQRSFTASEGQLITLKIRDVTVTGSQDLDAFWPHLFGPDGKELTYDVELPSFGSKGLQISLQIPVSGTYVIDIESYKRIATGEFEISVIQDSDDSVQAPGTNITPG